MQRDVESQPSPLPCPCPQCGAALRTSHREYAGRGASVTVLRCAACGRTVSSEARPDADRRTADGRAGNGRSRRHAPVDEGPPSNPVLDPGLAARLLKGLEG